MNNQEIIDKGPKYVMNTYGRFPLALVKGSGCRVWDGDGNEYLDFACGIAVCSLGHAHPELVKTLQDQAEKLWHCSNLYWIEPQVELAEKLCRATGMERAFFANSGAEANEGALKLARKYFYRKGEERNQIISFSNSFHGRTVGALAATGQTKYQEGFQPLMPGVVYAEYNDLSSVEKLLNPQTCAVMVEAIQGEGGVNPAHPSFLAGLSDLCRRSGVLLIIDEVQTGMGRTGKMMAYQNYGIKPDIVTLAKALGNGMPISALLATEEAASGFAPGDHASTFGGNPLACAVAARAVDLLSAPELLESVTRVGESLKQELAGMAAADPRVLEVRGRGLMIGMEFKNEVKELIEICRAHGLLLISAGSHVLRLVPPLNITLADVSEAVNRLQRALEAWPA
jgi:predicted acetylornithine/succinylornithine family transaminase